MSRALIFTRILPALLSVNLLLGSCSQGLEPLGLNLVTPEQEVAAGQGAWKQIRQKERTSPDRALQARVRQIGERLVVAAGVQDQPWEFVAFENEQVNAFALPGGHVGVYTGLINLAENDAQLAAVMGHEIGHVLARHAGKRMSTAMATQVGLSVAQSLGGSNGQVLGQLLGLGAQYGVLLPYSRTQEYEADSIGLQIMAQAGYDPREALNFWIRMSDAKGGAPGWSEFMSTHPVGQNRIRAMEQQLPEVMPVYEQAAGQPL